MIILSGRITALEPLHIGNGITVGTFVQTLSYIPARSIRGMLGNYLFNQKRDLFEALRIDDDREPQLYFKPSLPLGSVAAPLAFRWCKKCNRLLAVGECPNDFHEGEKRGGFMLRSSLETKEFKPVRISKSINTKCPINAQRHASYAEDEERSPYNIESVVAGTTSPHSEPTPLRLSPYNIESVVAGTAFDFRLVLPEEFLKEVKDALVEAGVFYKIGGFRSRGYGMIKFDFEGTESVSDFVKRRSQEIQRDSWMVFNSPAVFQRNGSSRYLIGLTSEILKPYLSAIAKRAGIGSLGEIEVRHSSYKQTHVRGWKIAGKYYLDRILPAVDLGSTARLEIDPEVAAWLEVFGIGEMPHINGDVYFLCAGESM